MEKNIGQKICDALFSGERPHFREVPGGLEIVYPWRGPGDAFYINKQQKRWIVLLNRTLTTLFVSSVALLTLLSDTNAMSFDKQFEAVHILLWVSFSVLCGIVFLFGKNATPYTVPVSERIKNTPSWVWAYFFIFSAWFFLSLIGYAPMSKITSLPFVIMMLVLDGFFAVLAAWLLWRSKTTGLYFFT
ncbi:hypothetical protein [Micavibrio aeruginosavorus]|uniref:hypothetical protein n=1 Tax=Micavibrio aeruginosavorus TaxID=349221 RepID=UPI003F4ABB8A